MREPRRARLKVRGPGRAVTYSSRRTSKVQLDVIVAATNYPEEVARPVTRGDCQGGQRPCPFVSCKWHLYVDVHQVRGSLKVNFPDLEVWELQDSCALDVADRGGMILEDVGAMINLTRERVRQVETDALAKIEPDSLAEHTDGDSRDPGKKRRRS